MPVTACVIICTYNRSRLLKRLLLSLSSQTMNPDRYEILVFDDGSTDDTADTCKEMMGKMKNLGYLSKGENLKIAKAQNIAIRETQGEHLLFIDDDCIPEKDWVERLSSALEREPIVAGSVATAQSNFMTICHNIAEFHSFMPGRKAGYTDFIAGANMGFRRSMFNKLGGFKEGTRIGPDMEMVLRARANGYKVYFEPCAIVTHHPMRTSFMEIMRYAASHASSTILLRNQYRALLRTPFLLRSSALLLAASPLIALKVTAEIYIRNRNLTRHLKTFPVVFALKMAWCWGASKGLRDNRKAILKG